MKDFETPNNTEKYTIEKAAVEILTQLGGKAHRKQIIPYILAHVPLDGKTPEKSITASLIRATQVRKAGGGYWELVSYQEEIAKRDAEIARLKKENEVQNKLIIYMKSDKYHIVIISTWMQRYMKACKKKSQSVRENIQKVFTDIASKLKFQYTEEAQESLDHFDDETPPVINVVKKEYNDNASSTDIDIPGITPQDLKELISAKQQNSLGNKSQKLIS